jgi:hypothetical protein
MSALAPLRHPPLTAAAHWFIDFSSFLAGLRTALYVYALSTHFLDSFSVGCSVPELLVLCSLECRGLLGCRSSGGVDWPYSSKPQHSTLPVFVMPQVWLLPALTLSKVPAGGVDWP